MKRCLVTGAQGFIGRYLVRRLVEGGAEVIGVGRSPALPGFFTHSVSTRRGKVRAPLPFEALGQYRQASLAELKPLVEELRPDCVFHLASATHSAPQADLLRSNIEGTAALLDAIGPARLVLGSSSSVYGPARRLPIDELHPCLPENLYGVSKLAAEHVARVKARPVVARIFNVIGPGQTETHACGRFAAQLALGTGTVEAGSLEATRDFVDVRDVAEMLAALGERGEPGEVYNVASGRECSIGALLDQLIELSGRPVRVVHREGIPSGVPRQVADVSKLSMAPRFSLRETLRDVLDYHRRLDE